MKEVPIARSSKPGNRLVVKFPNKHVDYGSKSGSTFVDHQDVKIKKAREARHKVNHNWSDWDSAGSLAKHGKSAGSLEPANPRGQCGKPELQAACLPVRNEVIIVLPAACAKEKNVPVSLYVCCQS